MTRSRAACLCMVMAVVPGCGTMSNLNGEPVIGTPTPKPVVEQPSTFGGVERDLGRFQFACFAVPQYPSAAFYALGYLADVPLSLVGDVVTLPIVLWQLTQNLTNPDPPDRDSGTQ